MESDYVIRIHILEVHHLRGPSEGTLADPYVTVECCGQKESTPHQNSRLNAYFNQTFVFRPQLAPAQLFDEVAVCRVIHKGIFCDSLLVSLLKKNVLKTIKITAINKKPTREFLSYCFILQ